VYKLEIIAYNYVNTVLYHAIISCKDNLNNVSIYYITGSYYK